MTTSINIPYPENSLSPAQAKQARAPEITNDDFFASFADILDVINPLQHIPGISTLYRQMTGDTLSTGARLAGGAIFGGGIGFLVSLVNSLVEQETGKDIGSNVFAAVAEKYKKAEEVTQG
jgi:hypothetical protein